MSEAGADTPHFAKAMTELRDKCPVVTKEAIFNERGVKILETGVAVNAKL